MGLKKYRGRLDFSDDHMDFDVVVGKKQLDPNRVLMMDWQTNPEEVMESVNMFMKHAMKAKGEFVLIETDDDNYVFYFKK